MSEDDTFKVLRREPYDVVYIRLMSMPILEFNKVAHSNETLLEYLSRYGWDLESWENHNGKVD